MAARLGLGTVQFGMHYGISNDRGQPTEAEIADILGNAESFGVGYLDTAFAYPNSETLIGRHLPRGRGLKIVTKTAPIHADRIEPSAKTKVLDDLALSMDRLRTGRLHGLLLHHATDLDKPGWHVLVEALEEAQARGWVELIGASIYNEKELQLVESRFSPGMVQAPFNVLDTRLVASQCFARLKSKGVEIHARSLFLQGLLLMQPSALPAYFEPLKPALDALRMSWAADGLDPLAACLGYVLSHPAIDVAIVGVNRLSELQEICQAASSAANRTNAPAGFPKAVEEKYLDPSLWPSFTY